MASSARSTSRRAADWLPALVCVAVLACWEVGVRLGGITALFFPAPSTIWVTIVATVLNGTLLPNLWATVWRVGLGLVLGGVPGLILGVAMGWQSRIRAALDPVVAAAHALPKIAILPLFMIVFGIDEQPRILVAALAAFFPILINTMDGVRQINPTHLEVAINYGAGPGTIVARVLLPASMPFALSGLRLALNNTLLLTVAVEMISARTGLGAMIWSSWETLRTEQLYVSLLAILILGVGGNAALQWAGARLAPWRQETDRS